MSCKNRIIHEDCTDEGQEQSPPAPVNIIPPVACQLPASEMIIDIGREGTPFFIAVKLNGKDAPEVFYSQAGPLPEADVFLGEIKNQIALR